MLDIKENNTKEYGTEECFPLEFSNISVVDAPLVKDYYWEWLNLGKLNRHLLSTKNVYYTVFNITVPTMPIYSMPVKLIIFITNESAEIANWTIKRKKLCDCVIKSVPTGINTFKKAYVCPHRELLTLSPNEGTVESGEMFEVQMYITYVLLGETNLTYELMINNRFRLRLNFVFRVTEFDPLTCIITKNLFSIYVGEVKPIIQPIWIFNHYNQDMEFFFHSDDPCLEIVTTKLSVTKFSLTTLLVKFKPQNVGDMQIPISMYFVGVKNDFIVLASGLLFAIPIPAQLCPKKDISTLEYPFTIFENFIGVKLNIYESSSTMVAVHNFSEVCVNFQWRPYEIEGLFKIVVFPEAFVCHPNHAQLCIVTITVMETPCVFVRVPIACEVFTNKTKTEMEESPTSQKSINSEFSESATKFLKRIWLNVNFRVENTAQIQMPPGRRGSEDSDKYECLFPRDFDKSKFNKLLWDHIFGINFLSMIMNTKTEGASYEQLFEKKSVTVPFIDRKLTLEVLRMIVADAVKEISRQWRFIPIEVAYP